MNKAVGAQYQIAKSYGLCLHKKITPVHKSTVTNKYNTREVHVSEWYWLVNKYTSLGVSKLCVLCFIGPHKQVSNQITLKFSFVHAHHFVKW